MRLSGCVTGEQAVDGDVAEEAAWVRDVQHMQLILDARATAASETALRPVAAC